MAEPKGMRDLLRQGDKQLNPPPSWPRPLMKGKWKITDVVPADLARELYEALKDARTHKVPWNHDPTRAQSVNALARYEREVEPVPADSRDERSAG